MNGAIIINFHAGEIQNKTNRKIERFKEEFSKLNVQLKVYLNDGNLASIIDGKVILNFERPDFVIYLDKDEYLSRLLERAGLLVINSSDFMSLCDDKMLTHIECANHDILMPKTIAGPLLFNPQEYTKEEKEAVHKTANDIGYPLLIKGVHGSLGKNMILVKSEDELDEKFLVMRGQPILFQKYLLSSYGRSVRVIVIDNRIFGAFERYNPLDYRSNFSEGASSKSIEITKPIEEVIAKLLNVMNIPYAGVDLLYGDDNVMYLCEINSNAFFAEFEKITGKNVAKAFAEMVLRKCKNEQK